MKKLFILCIAVIAFTSCATSFQDSYTNGNTTKINNLSRISGKYEMLASKEYDEKGTTLYLKSDKKRYSLPSHIENKIPNITTLKDVEKIIRGMDTESLEWTKNDEVEVQAHEGYLSFTFIKDGQPIKTLTYPAKLKNGFAYLSKEKNCVKVPFVINGCVKSEKRIGLDKDGDLLIHEVNKINTSSVSINTFLKYYGEKENTVLSFKKSE